MKIKLNKNITTNVPGYENLKVYQLDKNNYISFVRLSGSPVYAYVRLQFNSAAMNDHIEATMLRTDVIDPSGFVYNGEIYQIED